MGVRLPARLMPRLGGGAADALLALAVLAAIALQLLLSRARDPAAEVPAALVLAGCLAARRARGRSGGSCASAAPASAPSATAHGESRPSAVRSCSARR